MLSLIKNKNFMLLFSGQSISTIGDYILYIVLPFYIYKETSSVMYTGMMFISLMLPGIFFGHLSGVFADRLRKKNIMLISDITRAIIVLMILLFQKFIVVIYLLVFVESAISVFFTTARDAIIPILVPAEDLAKANLLTFTSGSSLKVVVPFIGGLLMATFGVNTPIYVDFITYIISFFTILYINDNYTSKSEERKRSASIISGFFIDINDIIKYIIKNTIIFKIIISLSIEMIGQGIFTSLIVPYVESYLHGNAKTYGLLVSLQGLGGLISALWFIFSGRKVNTVVIFRFSSLIIGAFIIFAITSQINKIFFITLFFVGLISVAYAASSKTIIQNSSDNDYIGRVFGILSTVGSFFTVFGILLGSMLGKFFGIPLSVDISGCFFMISGVLSLIYIKESYVRKIAVKTLE